MSLIRAVFWICLGGITVSVSALILIVSIMGGFGRSVIKRHLSGEPHLIRKLEKNPFHSPYSLKETLPETLQKGIALREFYELQDVIIQTEEGFSGAVARGDGFREWRRKKSRAVPDKAARTGEGAVSAFGSTGRREGVTAGESTAASLPELLIGRRLSFDLNLFPGDEATLIPAVSLLLPPGEGLPLRRVKVAGVLDGPAEGGVGSVERSLMIFYKQGEVDFGVFSDRKYKEEIRLKDPHQVALYKPYFKKAQTWRERNSSLFFALKIEKFIMTLFIALALVISCLGISSALLLLMTQKGKDIGMFQALGLSQKALCRTFTRLGFCLSLCGIFLGTLIGVGGAAFFKYTDWNFLPSQYQDRNIPAVFDPEAYILIVLGSLLTAYLACFLPARSLSGRDPARLLKITGR